MTDLAKIPVVENCAPNAPAKVRFRERIMLAEQEMKQLCAAGALRDNADECKLTHYYSPIDPKYSCCAYARQILLPKGSLVIGKIHKHQHLNFIMQGKVSVNTEFGKKYFAAPCIFLSEIGLKRAVYAEEDTIWVTVHLTEHRGEENLDKMEDEIIAKTYEEIGLISNLAELRAGE